MSKVLAVAWRDFRHTALTKTFILAVVFVPMLMGGAMFFAQYFMNTQPPALTGTLIVVDPSNKVESSVRLELDPKHMQEAYVQATHDEDEDDVIAQTMQSTQPSEFPSSHWSRRSQFGRSAPPAIQLTLKFENDPSSELRNELKLRVRNGEVTAVAIIPPELLTSAPAADTFELYVTPGLIPDHTELLEKTLGRAIVRARVQQTGSELARAQALVHQPMAKTTRITPDGVESSDNPIVKRLLPMAFMMLLWISTFTSANYLLTSTIEEKSNKVMEVLLSAVSPMQLMTGKILGQGLVGLVMLFMYSTLGMGAVAAMSLMYLVPAIKLVYLGVYFIMAYFMIASIMTGVGSAVSDLREAQALVTPATLVLVIPLMLWYPISQNPNGPLATVTSFIPPITPFAMILRVTGSEPVPSWQIFATMIYGFAMMVVMVGMCAKVFRVGILMYGKPPTPWELLKWVRYS
jgi:ABC-2 type transport system permease protein